MNYTAQSIPYERTNAFSKIVIDYINQDPDLQPFYQYPVSEKGILDCIAARKLFPTDRQLLVRELKKQYAISGLTSAKVNENIELLADENTFTICTAHQPNIFTGYLYFVYKILHIIKIANSLGNNFKQYKFVPVFYMGSEDNDLDELNRINLNGDKLVWDTPQSGAVGRMKNEGLDNLIERISGQLSIHHHGPELISLLRESYLKSGSIQDATFRLIHALHEVFGLVILLPDNAAFKRKMIPIFEEDIFKNTPSEIFGATAARLEHKYHAQVNPREINLFYLLDGIRERIIFSGDVFKVNNTNLVFSETELRKELESHPERFSPNVVLRGIFQETILPNIAFVGGGSELAYWLEMKDMFVHFQVPFPVLILRNSFLIIDARSKERAEKLGLRPEDLFQDESELLTELVKNQSSQKLSLDNELKQTLEFYKKLRDTSEAIDPTLTQHVAALEVRAYKALEDLEKKMLRAEKKKFEQQKIQIQQLKSTLFPENGLQERSENILPYYAHYGPEFIKVLYDSSPSLEQKFIILCEG